MAARSTPQGIVGAENLAQLGLCAPQAQGHHCRAVIGCDTDGVAYFCGEAVTVRPNGLPSSWCAQHHAEYTVPPRPPAKPRAFTFRRKPSSRLLSAVEG